MANNNYTYKIQIDGKEEIVKLNNLIKETDNTIGGLEKRKRVLEDLIKNVDRNSAEFRKLSTELNNTNKQLKQFDATIEGVGLLEFAEAGARVAGGIGGAFGIATVAAESFGESLGISTEEIQKAEAQFQKMLLVVQSFTAIADGLKSLPLLFSGISSAVGGLKTAFLALNTATKASIIGAGVAGVALLVTYWEDITNFISGSNTKLKKFNDEQKTNLDITKQRIDLITKSYGDIQKTEIEILQNQLDKTEDIDKEITLLKRKEAIIRNEFNTQIKKSDERKKDLEIEKAINAEIVKIDEYIKTATNQRDFLLKKGLLTKESEQTLNEKIRESEERRLGLVADLNSSNDLTVEKNKQLLSIQKEIEDKEAQKASKQKEINDKLNVEKQLRQDIKNILDGQVKSLDDINDSKNEENLKALQLQLRNIEINAAQDEKLQTGNKLQNLALIRDKKIEIEKEAKKIALDNLDEEKQAAIDSFAQTRDSVIKNENATNAEKLKATTNFNNAKNAIEKLFTDKKANLDKEVLTNQRDINETYLDGVSQLAEDVKKIGDDANAQIVVKVVTETEVKASGTPTKTAEELRKEQIDKIVNNANQAANAIANVANAVNQLSEIAITNLNNELNKIDLRVQAIDSKIQLSQATIDVLEAESDALSANANEALLNNNLTALQEVQKQRDINLKSIADERKANRTLINEKNKLDDERIKKEEEISKRQQQIAKVNAVVSFASAAANTASAIAAVAANSGKQDFTFGILTVAAVASVLGTLIAGIATAKSIGGFAEGGYTSKNNKLGERDESGFRVAGVVHEGEYVIPKRVLDDPRAALVVKELENIRINGFGSSSLNKNIVIMNDNSGLEDSFNRYANRPVVTRLTDINEVTENLNQIIEDSRS